MHLQPIRLVSNAGECSVENFLVEDQVVAFSSELTLVDVVFGFVCFTA